jgi:hypothetical protein
LRDFYAISVEQGIGELLLTPRTLDRPFFSELNAKPVAVSVLDTSRASTTRFGEWGEVYGAFLTGNRPREFPLTHAEKWAENLFILRNSALPPPQGK